MIKIYLFVHFAVIPPTPQTPPPPEIITFPTESPVSPDPSPFLADAQASQSFDFPFPTPQLHQLRDVTQAFVNR